MPESCEHLREGEDNQNTAQADKLPEDDLIKILRQSGLHGAGGPSRRRKGLLVGLLGQPTAAQAWTQLMTLLAQGQAPSDVMHAHGWCTLHGLLKDKTKTEVRPLGVGEYFRRLIASTLLRARRTDLLQYFFGAAAAEADTNRKPYQFAVGVKAGVDMLCLIYTSDAADE